MAARCSFAAAVRFLQHGQPRLQGYLRRFLALERQFLIYDWKMKEMEDVGPFLLRPQKKGVVVDVSNDPVSCTKRNRLPRQTQEVAVEKTRR